MARSRSLPAALAPRAKVVPGCEREPGNRRVAERLGVDNATAGKWRTIEDEAIARVLNKTPSAETGLSKTSVHRLLQTFSLKPHRTRN